jgi:hypothetical protein
MPTVLPSKPSTAAAPSATMTLARLNQPAHGARGCTFASLVAWFAIAADWPGVSTGISKCWRYTRSAQTRRLIILVSTASLAHLNGSPCSSPSAPGASPINSCALMSSTPNTTFLRDAARWEHHTATLAVAIGESRRSASGFDFRRPSHGTRPGRAGAGSITVLPFPLAGSVASHLP